MGKMGENPRKPWDRRPWAASGAEDTQKLFALVGMCLSAWESYEAVLAILFSMYVTIDQNLAAKRAFFAVRTFDGRLEMLRAASEAYFSLNKNEIDLQRRHVEIYKSARMYAPRRNEIAHGVVQAFYPEFPWPPTSIDETRFALFPTQASYKEREIDNKPSYCYSIDELEHIYGCFTRLPHPIVFLISDLITRRAKMLIEVRRARSLS